MFCNSAGPNGHKGTKTGNQDDLIKLAFEQQAKLQKEKDNLEATRQAQALKDDADAAARAALGDGANRGDGSGDGPGDRTRDGSRDSSGDGSGGKTDGDEGAGDEKNKNLLGLGDDKNNKDHASDKEKKRLQSGPLVPDTIKGIISLTAFCID